MLNYLSKTVFKNLNFFSESAPAQVVADSTVLCTYIHLYILTPPFLYSYICTYVHMYICTYVHIYIPTPVVLNLHVRRRWRTARCSICYSLPRCVTSSLYITSSSLYITSSSLYITSSVTPCPGVLIRAIRAIR